MTRLMMCRLNEPKGIEQLEGIGSWMDARKGQDKAAMIGANGLKSLTYFFFSFWICSFWMGLLASFLIIDL